MTEVKNRWAASAVLDSAGAWHLVLSADHVQGEASSRRVKLFSGGSFGRGFFRDAEWFKANAVRLYLGALRLPDGGGARAIHRVGDHEYIVSVSSPDEPVGGEWSVMLSKDGDGEETSLGL